MTINRRRFIYVTIAISVWLLLWEILARAVNVDYIFPSFTQTVGAFIGLIKTANFYLTVFFSIFRILLGFLVGSILGVILGFISHISDLAFCFIHPVMSVIRSTPVASIIIIIWFFIPKEFIPIVIGLFMVSPIIWQSTYDSLHIKNKELAEVADIFGIKGGQRFKILVLPTVIKYLFPAIVTSSGLAWKSGVAAEIITYTRNSIGFEISNAKNALEGADMLAWTITVILLNATIELIIRYTIRRLQSKWA